MSPRGPPRPAIETQRGDHRDARGGAGPAGPLWLPLGGGSEAEEDLGAVRVSAVHLGSPRSFLVLGTWGPPTLYLTLWGREGPQGRSRYLWMWEHEGPQPIPVLCC